MMPGAGTVCILRMCHRPFSPRHVSQSNGNFRDRKGLVRSEIKTEKCKFLHVCPVNNIGDTEKAAARTVCPGVWDIDSLPSTRGNLCAWKKAYSRVIIDVWWAVRGIHIAPPNRHQNLSPHSNHQWPSSKPIQTRGGASLVFSCPPAHRITMLHLAISGLCHPGHRNPSARFKLHCMSQIFQLKPALHAAMPTQSAVTV